VRSVSEPGKVDRSLAQCALKGARATEAAGDLEKAVGFWEALRLLEPGSEPALRGIERCLLTLARRAEEAGDGAAAQRHWNALVRAFPEHERAADNSKPGAATVRSAS
jgi:hypothetical protein